MGRSGRTLAALALAACASAACTPRPERVVIGVALTNTVHPAIEMAVREINGGGGVRGVPIELMGLDWRFGAPVEDPEEILRWAERFAETEDLVAVIGHSDSTSTLSAAAFYNQRQVPQIVTIATNPAITNIGEWTYRLCLSDAAQGPALADYAVHTWGKRRIAVFYVNDDYGRGLARLFEARVRELGGEIVASVPHRNSLRQDDEQLIRWTLADLKRGGEPDLFALFQRNTAVLWTLRAIRGEGFTTAVLGGDSLGLGNLLQRDPEVMEGLRASQFFLLQPGDERAQRFADALADFAGQEANYGAAFAYDAVYLVRDAIRHGGFSRQGVKAYLDRLIETRATVQGVGGDYRLGPDHDARRRLFLAEAQGGRFHLLHAFQVE